MWLGTKLRENPKALITKLKIERFIVASLIIEGIVISLEILDLTLGMGYRGSKSDSYISVKEQRADGSSIFIKYCKVCSMCQGNLVLKNSIWDINTILSLSKKYSNLLNKGSKLKRKNILYLNNIQKHSYSTQTTLFQSSYSILNPYYVTGFTEGEGCFFIGVNSDSNYKTGYRVKAIFQIGLHIKDIALLQNIQLFFGLGKITKLGSESVQYRVSSLEGLNFIINHFDNYPLLTRKHSDYLLFKEVINLMKEGKHLTLEGLNRVISIKASLNSGKLSKELSLAFPKIDSALKPRTLKSKLQDLHWLAGFTDAEGCFFIALKKSVGNKLGETVWLRFILTQHNKDKELLESLISTLNCGRLILKLGYGEFIVEKFTDISEKIIPIFDKFQLQGHKLKNYEDFKQAALLIKNKAHLTREGLDEIKKIKGRMNKNRV